MSIAVKVQDPPVDSKATSLKLATPALAVTVSVPAIVQEDVSVIESVAPVPDVITAGVLSSTETAKVAMFAPVVAVDGGAVVNTR